MDCIFCRIAKGEIPSKKIYEDEKFLAFLDINPRNPGHTLVIPKEHHQTFLHMDEGAAAEYMGIVNKVAKAVAAGTQSDGINILNNTGRAAGGLVDHVHFHVIPRFRDDGSASLESVLQPKKIDDNRLNTIAESIKNNIKPGTKEVSKEPAESTEEKEDIFAGREEMFENEE